MSSHFAFRLRSHLPGMQVPYKTIESWGLVEASSVFFSVQMHVLTIEALLFTTHFCNAQKIAGLGLSPIFFSRFKKRGRRRAWQKIPKHLN